MEGLLLVAAYLVAAVALEAVAIGIGFFTDDILPAWSSAIFMADTGPALWAAWPIAVWMTRNQVT